METYRSDRGFCQSLFSGRISQQAIFPYPRMDVEEGETIRIFLESLGESPFQAPPTSGF